MRAREVTTPAGERWRVGRRWVPRFGGRRTRDRVTRRFRRAQGDSGRRPGDRTPDALDGAGFLVEALDGGLILVAVVAVIFGAVFLGVPVVMGALELLVVAGVALAGVVARVVFRRPWVVEAEAVDGPGRGRLAAWRVVGWRASAQQIVDVVRSLEAGIDLPSGAVEERPRLRPRR